MDDTLTTPRFVVSVASDQAQSGAVGFGHDGRLCVVAESAGMGARVAGTAQCAVESFVRAFQPTSKDVQDVLAGMRIAFAQANRMVLSECPGAGLAAAPHGVSLVALNFTGSRLVVGHVGNARCYRTRAGTLTALTHDHTALAELGDKDEALPDSDPFQVHHRNLLTRALGMGETIDPELASRSVRPGDRFLLCSASVWAELPNATMLAFMEAQSADAAVACFRPKTSDVGRAIVVAIPDVAAV